MHKEKSAFPQSPGIRAHSDYIISAHTAEVNQYTTISQGLEHLQGWGLHITQQGISNRPRNQIIEVGYFQYMGIGNQRYSQYSGNRLWESDLMLEVTRG